MVSLKSMCEVTMNKYDPLLRYLSEQKSTKVVLSLSEIETIINDELPTSAYSYPQWWSNSRTQAHPYCRAWLDAGYHTVDIKESLQKKIITFEK